MKLSERYSYGYGDWTVEIEVNAEQPDAVELAELYSVRDANDAEIDLSEEIAAEIEEAIRETLAEEVFAGAWEAIVADKFAQIADDLLSGDDVSRGVYDWEPMLATSPAGCAIH